MFKTLALSTLGLVASSSSLDFKTASSIIKAHVDSYKIDYEIGQSMCDKYSCCNVTATQSCNVNTMPKDETTLVLPGGNTRCIFSTSTPFAFQVIPGDSDKVLLYFQGGGACWDEASTKAGFCTTDVSPQGPTGVFDRSDAKNPYRDYTVVHVSYCSGDIFGGNVVRDYTDSAGVPVTQKGFDNAQSAVNWIVGQQASGNLASSLSSLVVMGCSAGSIGAQLWGNQAVTNIKWNTAAVIPDSYAGVFPDGTQGPLIYDYGMCTVAEGFINAENQAKCNAQTLTLQDIDQEFISATPEVPYSFIQSKTDIVQMSFYVAVGFTSNATAAITPEIFYDDVNTIFEGYNVNENFLTYLVDGDQHCFSPMDLFFTADGISSTDDGKTATQEMMYEWTAHFPLPESGKESTVCEGTVQASGSRAAVNDQTYCSAELMPKTFTEDYN